MTLVPGTALGRYQVIEPLGSGGMATVYKAYQPSLEREVALKVLRPGFADDPEFLARFQREARAIAKLRHPHIVQVFDFEQVEGRYLLAMEYLEGGTLKDRLAEGAPLPPAEVARIVSEVAEALAYGHARGIVHRDIKPSNVMLADGGRAVVTDFGIAKIIGGEGQTQTGVGMGTPEYMAPEQGLGSAVDGRADIYALGAMAYELLTGRVPFTADTPLAVVLAHVRDPLPLPSRLNPAISAATERALLKALAKDPAQRFASAPDFAAALRDGLGTAPKTPLIVAHRAGARVAPLSIDLSALRSRPVALAVAAALVVLAGGGVALSGAFAQGGTSATAAPSLAAAVAGATPATTVAPSSPPAQSPARGALLWQATFDAAGSDLALPRSIVGDPSASDVRPRAGALDIAARQAGQTGISFKKVIPSSFVGELEFQVRPGSDFNFWWNLHTKGGTNYNLYVRAKSEVVVANYFDGQQNAALGPSIAVPGLQSGRVITIAVVANEPRYTVYIDAKQAGEFTDSRLNFVSAAFNLGAGAVALAGADGSVTITGVRAYALPASAATAPAAPKFAVPPKGALYYEAKLDGTAGDLRQAPTKAGDASATDFRLAPGSIELSTVRDAPTGTYVQIWPDAPTVAGYIAEIDLSFVPGSQSELNLTFRDGLRDDGRTGAAYRMRIWSASETIWLFYTEFDSSGNAVPNSAQEITSRAPIPGLQTGRTFTIALVVEAARYTVYLDQTQILQASDTRLGRPTKPPYLRALDKRGTVRITGIRYYNLP